MFYPIDTATRRRVLPMTYIPEREAWMGYEEFKQYLFSLNLTPIAHEAAIKAYCDKRGL